ncbi:NACHT domain-containing protein [Amycolatopsis vancoresmycina]|uniref:NACHT domain-containing protein n=1 Tax=Amycolatopsis vancoresmycina TaxID=208444 RepID=UPI0012DF9548|nr:NACHT domain-containing protein [Amycolatopsis vancoresmycina]
MADDGVHNHVSGTVAGHVVQARHIGVVNLGERAAFDAVDYLRAVRRAAEGHPVVSREGLSADTVPLSAVYVDRDLVDRSTGRPGTWRQALAASDHLVVFGGPGGGKSSLLRRIAAALAEDQDASAPCLPVPVHARRFRAGIPLATAIRDGAVAELGSFLLTGLPADAFAAAPPAGGTWLVLVDGLDEVAGIDEARVALEAITEGARHPFLRFVVATRPVPDTDLRAAGNRFAGYELRPFDVPALGRFVRRWLELRGVAGAAELGDGVVAHVRRNGFMDWLLEPLAATMLCGLLLQNPGRRLPGRLSDLYEQYVRKLFTGRAYTNAERRTHRDVVQLLEKVASERLFRSPDLPVLAAAGKFARGTPLEPAAADPGVRARELHDVLCRTGLVVSAAGDLEFAHATFEEYLAARRVADRLVRDTGADRWRTLDRVFEALAAQYGTDSGESDVSQVFRFSQVPVFLADIWSARAKDTDVLLEHLVRYSPDGGWWLVRRLAAAGLTAGPGPVAALAEITGDASLSEEDHWGAAITLRDLGHPEGIARLLAMVADADLPDFERIRAMRECGRSGASAAAAAGFLGRSREFPDWEYPHSVVDAAEAMPADDDEALSEGLDLVLGNRHLPEGIRLHAGSVAVVLDGEAAYRKLLAQRFRRLGSALGEQAARGVSEAYSVLWRMVRDPELAGDLRWDAADELAALDDDTAGAAFRALAEDPGLDERYRRRAAQAAAGFD